MSRNNLFILTAVVLLFSSCKSCSNMVGQKVGESVGEFTEGIGKGAEEAFDIIVQPSEDLKKKGIKVGKVLLGSDTASKGHDNKLSVYLSFDESFKDVVTVKISDAKGLEMGRSKDSVDAKKGDAGYYDFIFDARTNIDSDSKIVIE